MEKQEKKNYTKKAATRSNSNSFKYIKSKARKLKESLRIKKFLKYKTYKPLLQKIVSSKRIKKFSQQLSIRVTANNIFCNLRNIVKNTTIATCSSGKYKIKTTRKKLKHNIKLVLSSFFSQIRTKIPSKNLVVVLTSPVRIKKQTIKILAQNFNKYNLIVKVKDKKCFNGCRPPKKKRKKQKGLRLFK